VSDHLDPVAARSGFRGSAMAYRLSETGLRWPPLEFGRAYPPGTAGLEGGSRPRVRVGARRWRSRLRWYNNGLGHRLTLCGHKVIKNDPGIDVRTNTGLRNVFTASQGTSTPWTAAVGSRLTNF
jgi:hypothetical protein